MSTLNITIAGGTSKRLPTAGKYCEQDIIITAEGGGESENLLDTYLSGKLTSLDTNLTTLTDYACYTAKSITIGMVRIIKRKNII